MPIPIQEAIRDLTADLLGRPTAVDKTAERVEREAVAAIGAYRDREGAVLAALVTDRQLVAILGGALVMVPEVVIKEVLAGSAIADNLYENFWEVANIMSSLLNREGVPHVALADRAESWDGADAAVQALIDAPKRQRWFSVTVVGYGTGRLGVVAAT
jgi:hypothetical protein